jgi:multiple sugar transport system permease protein
VFFMTTYMRGIPRELDEAAMLDGASRWTIFWKVILPLTVPAQSTLACSPSSAAGTIIGGR